MLNNRLKSLFYLAYFSFILFSWNISVFSQSSRSVLIETKPKAVIWVDDVKHGETDKTGKLKIRFVKPGLRNLRVRAYGFKQVSKRMRLTAKPAIKVPLVKTNNPAEIAFQEAEKVLAEDKTKAIEYYRKALKLNPRYVEAHIDLARALTGIDNDAALETISTLRKFKPNFAEATVVEARIYRSDNDFDKAVELFDKAIIEGKGFQPEAYTGLALIFKNDASTASSAGDIEEEEYNYNEAAKNFEKAIDQLSATEPVVYMLLGEVYEKMGDKERAIKVYKRFLKAFPDHEEKTAVESFIIQLNRESIGDQ